MLFRSCLTVTHLDGLVLARSGFHSSMNYRAVVVLGKARTIGDREEKLHALEVISEQILKGRWAEIRGPSRKELNGTTVLALPIDEASAKIRTGPPIDDEEDYALPVWAGVLPLKVKAGTPLPDDRLPTTIQPPKYMKKARAYRHPKLASLTRRAGSTAATRRGFRSTALHPYSNRCLAPPLRRMNCGGFGHRPPLLGPTTTPGSYLLGVAASRSSMRRLVSPTTDSCGVLRGCLES